MNKQETLELLRSEFTFEEELVPKLVSFYQASDWRSLIDKKYHEEVEKGLQTLKEDAQRHA